MATTPFKAIIDRFIGKITEDLYLELTKEDTIRDAKLYLLDAIPKFEFPRFALYDYDEDAEVYNVALTLEEIDILAQLMKISWLDRQIASVEVTRMKYSGSDFKMTSQANHLAKLVTAKNEMLRENTHAQRIYKRRKFGSDGRVMSNWHILNTSTFDSDNRPAPDSEEEKRAAGTTETSGTIWEPVRPSDAKMQEPEEDDDYYWEPM